MRQSHCVNNDSSSTSDDGSSHCDTEDSTYVDISIYTVPGDLITQISEEAPNISSTEGDIMVKICILEIKRCGICWRT